MPTYEYRCPQGHEFEKFYRKISGASSELPCPECGQPATRQVSGGAGLLFKGSGFYLTDYGKNAHRKAPPPAGEKSGGEKKSESKPAESSSSSTSGGSESKPPASKPGSSSGKSES